MLSRRDVLRHGLVGGLGLIGIGSYVYSDDLTNPNCPNLGCGKIPKYAFGLVVYIFGKDWIKERTNTSEVPQTVKDGKREFMTVNFSPMDLTSFDLFDVTQGMAESVGKNIRKDNYERLILPRIIGHRDYEVHAKFPEGQSSENFACDFLGNDDLLNWVVNSPEMVSICPEEKNWSNKRFSSKPDLYDKGFTKIHVQKGYDFDMVRGYPQTFTLTMPNDKKSDYQFVTYHVCGLEDLADTSPERFAMFWHNKSRFCNDYSLFDKYDKMNTAPQLKTK